MNDDTDSVPAWARRSAGESRLAATVAILAIIALQWGLPDRLTVKPTALIPGMALILLVVLIVANPVRIDREAQWLRWAGLALSALLGPGILKLA